MGKYITTYGQNIYDVALHIHGSIEGIVDLMINNPSLSFNDDLSSGDELTHSDDFTLNAEIIAYNTINKITPSSGECKVYPKYFETDRFCEIYLNNSLTSVELIISGSGLLEVDWGDNSESQKIKLTQQAQNITHRFDNKISKKRRVSLYGVVDCKLFDISELNATSLYILKHLPVEQLVIKKSRLFLDFISLLTGVYNIDLSGGEAFNLLPLITCKELMSLNLEGTKMRESVIDEYLIALVREHENRRNCNVIISVTPSGSYTEPSRDSNGRYVLTSGMEAVWVLTHESAWNEGGGWSFLINNIIYNYEQND